MNPIPLSWTIIAVLALTAGSGAFGYYEGGKHKADSIAALNAREAALVTKARDAMTDAAATAISAIEVKNVTIRQKAETITREVPVYRDCHHSPDGLRVVNEALTGQEEPAGDGGVPAAATPDR